MLFDFVRMRFNFRQTISCGLLAAYLFAFVALPVLHIHEHTEHQPHCCHQEAEQVPPLTADDDCSICDVLHTTVSLYQFAEPLLLSAEVRSCILYLPLSLPNAEAVVLPPCRAPPLG
jgi:hypothetical protein